MKQQQSKSLEERRGFLKRAGQTGLLAGAAAVGAASGGSEAPPLADKPGPDGKRGYHETEHTRQYYRTSGIF